MGLGCWIEFPAKTSDDVLLVLHEYGFSTTLNAEKNHSCHTFALEEINNKQL